MTGIVYTIAALARLEDLIASVEDAQLRQVLADEVKALKSQTTFGLVYERHLPETLCLAANGGLRLNDDVRLRKDPADEDVRRVVKITGRRATLVDSDGVESTVPIADLMVVKRFGDPIFPTISSLGRVDRHKSRPYHTVINSENYHALQWDCPRLPRRRAARHSRLPGAIRQARSHRSRVLSTKSVRRAVRGRAALPHRRQRPGRRL